MATTFTAATVKAWLSIKSTDDDDVLAMVVAAVTSFIARLPVAPAGGIDGWDGELILAGHMLASRLYRRRNSPTGVEAFSADGATYVARHDPDVARMLRLNAPAVG